MNFIKRFLLPYFIFLSIPSYAFFYTTGIEGKFLNLSDGSVEIDISSGLPHKTILGKKILRHITAVCFSKNKKYLYAATKFTLHRFNIKKRKWKSISTKGINSFARFSAILSFKNNLYLGTTSYGVYKSIKNRWYRISRGLPGEENPKRRMFYETVTSLAADSKGSIYAGFHFSAGLYKLLNGKSSWKKIKLKKTPLRISSILPLKRRVIIFNGKKWTYSSTICKIPDSVKKSISLYKKSEYSMSFLSSQYNISLTKEQRIKKTRVKSIDRKKGLYFNPWRARPRILKYYIRYMKKRKLNLLVIDVKDDFGRILYKGKLAQVKALKAYYPILNIKKIVKLCKKNKIHLVARLVIFKDPKLHAYKKNKYAIKDKYTKKAWKGSGKEKWVNPFDPFVQKYNIDIAKEIISLGFDEVQFDYIRFPTDGPIYRCYYPGRKKNAWLIDGLENFLARADKNLKKPFSVDIYGFSGWFALGKWMGQDITMIANYADAISPMMYPSHFSRNFRINRGKKNQAFDIMKFGTMRSKILTKNKTVIRPYLQSFSWRAYRYGPAYLKTQINGVYKGGGSGYIFWDPSSKYKYIFRIKKF